MHFQQPNMLWGLFLLAIPLLIHLFQFHRTKTIYFPGVFRLTQRLQQARQQKRLQHWLVLIARMLGIACLVLAFAMPSCNDRQVGKGYSHVVLLVDNGFSMSVEGLEGQHLEQAKSQAYAILRDLPEETQVKLMSQTIQTDVWMSPSQLTTLLDTMTVGPQRFTLADWIDRVVVMQQESGVRNLAAVLFSDVQAGFLRGLRKVQNSPNIDWRFVQFNLTPTEVKGGNLSLDSAWVVSQFSADNQTEGLLLKASVSHRGGDVKKAQLQLMVDGKTLFAQTKDIGAEETVVFEGLVSAADIAKPMELRLGLDGFTFDNSLFLHPIKTWQTTVGVFGSDRALDALFSAQPLLKKRVLSVGDYTAQGNSLDGLDALVSIGAIKLPESASVQLKQKVEEGLTVLQFIPSASGLPLDLVAQRSLSGSWKKTDQRMALAGLNHPIFQGVFAERLSDKIQLPEIQSAFDLGSTADFETIIQLDGGQPLLVSRNIENGTQWLWLSDLQKGSQQFLNSGWYLPIVTQLLASKSIQEKPLYGVLFSKQLVALPAPMKTDERAAQLIGQGRTSVVELQTNSERHTSMYVGAEPTIPGHYQLKSPIEKNPVAMSFNWPRSESDLQSDGDWKTKFDQAGISWTSSQCDGKTPILQNEPLKVLWRLFIWGAAFFFAVEVLLLFMQSRKKSQEKQ